ncbi:DUF1844 domain-containing protein [Acidipila sp. EB88]|uniref:DUF1844 domain-containing protein n=1 Tax=Acidipila sp. EB88 TaxID=2305226 RepID=UPI000F5FB225|nr:DUF1844 domain-containing protein [Acidipila sp. EB88]RRA47481.1 DUF1844 domain-containing protein [Acidipila sp. EB88]
MAEKPPAFVVVDKRKFTAEGEIREGFVEPEKELPRTDLTPQAEAPAQQSGALATEEWSSAKVVTMPPRTPQASSDATATTGTAIQDADDLGDEEMAGSVTPFSRPGANAGADVDGDGPIEDDLAGLVSDGDELVGQPRSAAETAAQDAAYQQSAREIDAMLAQANPDMQQQQGPVRFEHVIQSFYLSAIMAMGAGTEPGQKPRIDILGARQSIDMLAVLGEKTQGNLSEHEQQLLQGISFELRMMFLELTNAISRQAHQPPPPGGGGILR